MLFSDNNVNSIGTPKLGIAISQEVLSTCRTSDFGHRTRQVIIYPVQCCYVLHWIDKWNYDIQHLLLYAMGTLQKWETVRNTRPIKTTHVYIQIQTDMRKFLHMTVYNIVSG